MPIVFVHGVNTRRDETYQKGVERRDGYLRQYALTGLVADPAQVRILNPYWGEWGATLAWDLASLPEAGARQEALGPEDVTLETALSDQAMALTGDAAGALLHMARQAPPESLREVIDLLFLQTLQVAQAEQAPELMVLAHKIYQYLHHHPKPDWLDEVENDQAFLWRLQQAVEAWQPPEIPSAEPEGVIYESFGEVGGGIWNTVEWGQTHLQQSFSRLSGQVISAGRTPIQQALSIFLGDVLKYIQMRGDKADPGPIVQTVVDALEGAVAARSAHDPHVIVIAHSMGGNICYDILSSYRPDLRVDVLVTVGSQVSLLEELKLFNRRIPNIPGTGGALVPKPDNIGHWLNVYNTNDVLSFACERVFAGVVDYAFPAGSLFGLRAAHSLYFQRVSFYERFAYRLRRFLT